jgi:hypothetical protein
LMDNYHEFSVILRVVAKSCTSWWMVLAIATIHSI